MSQHKIEHKIKKFIGDSLEENQTREHEGKKGKFFVVRRISLGKHSCANIANLLSLLKPTQVYKKFLRGVRNSTSYKSSDTVSRRPRNIGLHRSKVERNKFQGSNIHNSKILQQMFLLFVYIFLYWGFFYIFSNIYKLLITPSMLTDKHFKASFH